MDNYSDNSLLLVGPKIDVDVDERGVGAYLFDMCEKHADRICQVDADTGACETFSNVKTRSIRVAMEMLNSGIQRGDVVSMCTENVLESLVIFTASQFVGAKIASLDPIMTAKELAHLIKLVTPKMIFVQDASLQVISDALERVKHSAQIISLGHTSKNRNFDRFLERKKDESIFQPVLIEDIKTETSVIFFTSGSTGLSKAICISHYAVILGPIILLNKLGEIPKVLSHVSSMFWISAVIISMACFITGSLKVFTKNKEAENIARVIEKYKIEYCFLASYFSYKLATQPKIEKYDFSSIKWLYFGGAGVPAHRIQECKKLFRNENITLGYGMTELGCFATAFSLEETKRLAPHKPASSGTVLPSVILKIADLETERTLGTNQQGEIRIKIPSIMLGYYNQDCSTEFDEQGFFKTGDLGYYDEDKCVYIVSRIKETFTYQCHVIIPAAIEAEILKHEAVEQAIVFGIPDDINEHLPAACVVLKQNAKVTQEELLEYVNKQVGDRQRLRGGLKIIDYIPRTPTGKVNRRKFLETFLPTISR